MELQSMSNIDGHAKELALMDKQMQWFKAFQYL
jgi:hypothetical protein